MVTLLLRTSALNLEVLIAGADSKLYIVRTLMAKYTYLRWWVVHLVGSDVAAGMEVPTVTAE